MTSQLGRTVLSGSTGSEDEQMVAGEESAAHDELTAIIERAATDHAEQEKPKRGSRT